MLPAFQAGAEVMLDMKPRRRKRSNSSRPMARRNTGCWPATCSTRRDLEAGEHQLPTLRNAIGSATACRSTCIIASAMCSAGRHGGRRHDEVGTYYAVNPRYGQRKWGSVGEPDCETRCASWLNAGTTALTKRRRDLVTATSTIGYWQDARATAELLSGGGCTPATWRDATRTASLVRRAQEGDDRAAWPRTSRRGGGGRAR